MRVLTLCCLALVCVALGMSVPSRHPGVYYWGVPDSTLKLEVFGDYTCDATADFWLNVVEPLIDPSNPYGPLAISQLAVVYYPFSLPYHAASFSASKVMTTLDSLRVNSSLLNDKEQHAAHKYLFENQAVLYNDATHNVTRDDIEQTVMDIVCATPEISETVCTALHNGFADTESDTRSVWKYSCEHGVSGTPTTHVNGVAFQAPFYWGVEEWTNFLLGLLDTPYSVDL
ncbi:hypothetical protein KIPB_004585 [Kipferlia bialata]|uniref:Thioredoxin-like fold domain-containing protein n=1 Tax=Kipferlia bialata TaxID=797122 RepID=A0A9K3CVM3_9EUKA|nr:hypothetical protein KIPB_004585 [Kipferlia bialata]|eukprot:g4585.t1